MLRKREDWEVVERQTLAPYAMLASVSRGRRFAEPSHPMRTEFQRDRDRVIHSAAFRRPHDIILGGAREMSPRYRVDSASLSRSAMRADVWHLAGRSDFVGLIVDTETAPAL